MYVPSETIEDEEVFDEYQRFSNMQSACRVKFLPENCSDGSKSICLRFSETSVLNPGTYRLIYFSSINNSVLAVSNPFIAAKHQCTDVTCNEIGW